VHRLVGAPLTSIVSKDYSTTQPLRERMAFGGLQRGEIDARAPEFRLDTADAWARDRRSGAKAP
jgi:hypothetical protein